MRKVRFADASRRGMSLIEVVLAATIFAGVGYVLSLSMRASDQSYETVTREAATNAAVREFACSMTDELKGALRSSIAVTDVGGFDRIEFQTAISGVGAGPFWGAYERDLSIDELDCSQEGWLIRYGVQQDQDGARSLIRSIVDDSGVVQHTRTLAANVTEFSVTAAGDVWVVALTTQCNQGIRHEEFDVRTRTL